MTAISDSGRFLPLNLLAEYSERVFYAAQSLENPTSFVLTALKGSPFHLREERVLPDGFSLAAIRTRRHIHAYV